MVVLKHDSTEKTDEDLRGKFGGKRVSLGMTFSWKEENPETRSKVTIRRGTRPLQGNAQIPDGSRGPSVVTESVLGEENKLIRQSQLENF